MGIIEGVESLLAFDIAKYCLDKTGESCALRNYSDGISFLTPLLAQRWRNISIHDNEPVVHIDHGTYLNQRSAVTYRSKTPQNLT